MERVSRAKKLCELATKATSKNADLESEDEVCSGVQMMTYPVPSSKICQDVCRGVVMTYPVSDSKICKNVLTMPTNPNVLQTECKNPNCATTLILSDSENQTKTKVCNDENTNSANIVSEGESSKPVKPNCVKSDITNLSNVLVPDVSLCEQQNVAVMDILVGGEISNTAAEPTEVIRGNNSNSIFAGVLSHHNSISKKQNEPVLIEVDDPELRQLIESQNFILNDSAFMGPQNTKPNSSVSSGPSAYKVIAVEPKIQNDNEKTTEVTANLDGNIHTVEMTEFQHVEVELMGEIINEPTVEIIGEKTNQHIANDTECDLENTFQISDTREGRPKKGRKRKFKDQTREIKKRKVNTNQDYVNTKGETKFAKEFRDYHCNCRLKCNENISLRERNKIFCSFQESGSYVARCAIIQAMVKEIPIKRKRVKTSRKKNATREYLLSNTKVCKAIFMQTLHVSSCVIDKALKKKKSATVDARGSARGHNKLPNDKVEEVVEHISKFPKYKSHYCRSSTEAEYLHPETTLAVMYKMYCKESEKPVSFSMYKKVFLSKFNLRRKPLKKDTCNVCDRLLVEKHNASTVDLMHDAEEKHKTHLEMAEYARHVMNQQFNAAKEDATKETACISFDLEKTLPLPRIPTNIVFYKRQLWFYNFGVHDENYNGYCYTWVEGDAGRGAQEVGSCLRKHILSHIPPETKCLSLWSDSCGGQNRNIKIILLLKTTLEDHPSLEEITHQFLIPGHSFLRNDSDFSDIESALKLQQRLYIPEDYVDVILKCRKRKPFRVSKMEKQDFVGTSELEKMITNRKQCTEGEKINWLTFRVIQVRKSHPLSIFVKSDLKQNDFVEIYIGKKVGRKSKSKKACNGDNSEFFSSKLHSLWPTGKPISKEKLQDLKSLFHLIPKDCLPFYRNLSSSSFVEDDIEGFSGEPDFEPE